MTSQGGLWAGRQPRWWLSGRALGPPAAVHTACAETEQQLPKNHTELPGTGDLALSLPSKHNEQILALLQHRLVAHLALHQGGDSAAHKGLLPQPPLHRDVAEVVCWDGERRREQEGEPLKSWGRGWPPLGSGSEVPCGCHCGLSTRRGAAVPNKHPSPSSSLDQEPRLLLGLREPTPLLTSGLTELHAWESSSA